LRIDNALRSILNVQIWAGADLKRKTELLLFDVQQTKRIEKRVGLMRNVGTHLSDRAHPAAVLIPELGRISDMLESAPPKKK
jgi:hypothetical protein